MNKKPDTLAKTRQFVIWLVTISLSSWATQALAEPHTTTVALYEKGTNVFYLKAKVADLDEEEFMLDTGSAYLAINRDTMDLLQDSGDAHYQRKMHAQLANGSIKRIDIYRLASFKLSESCELYDVEAAVLPGFTRNILGMNVLKQAAPFGVSIGSEAKLTLSACNVRPETN